MLQVFHPLASVRRSVARLLSALCFLPAAEAWRAYPALAVAAISLDSSAMMAVPAPLLGPFAFPCKVVAVAVSPGDETLLDSGKYLTNPQLLIVARTYAPSCVLLLSTN